MLGRSAVRCGAVRMYKREKMECRLEGCEWKCIAFVASSGWLADMD